MSHDKEKAGEVNTSKETQRTLSATNKTNIQEIEIKETNNENQTDSNEKRVFYKMTLNNKLINVIPHKGTSKRIEITPKINAVETTENIINKMKIIENKTK